MEWRRGFGAIEEISMGIAVAGVVLWSILVGGSVQTAQPAPATSPVSLKAPDGIALKATYFSAGRPGPGILLLHACNRDRTSWTSLAADAARRGYHVLALDYRGFGESGGDPPGGFQAQQQIVREKWPGDVDAAFAWLLSQAGIDRNRIAAAGASCGVNQALLVGKRHPEVKTLVLLSGGATPEARDYLRATPGLPVFAAGSLDDGDIVGLMRWTLGWSRNPKNHFSEFKAAGHGTDMFAVEKELEPAILKWFDTHLKNAPATLAAPTTPAPPTPVEEFWTVLRQPGGVDKARRIYEETRRRDPKLVLFPEAEANQYGYELLQSGDVKGAIGVFQLNVDAYPKSANTYDSLSDAHLAAGNRDVALRLAEKALAVLDADTQINAEFRAAIRESAEKKVKELKR